ncbi:alpha/beta hydrolase [Siculibacillus lacustris]|uniref:Alpha/beta hydrolase n=1 Tax=Siculibacillus lacustris TaxID=1549641 RepID=A0A4Q9VIN6_9HYPH|nr:alpha/beta hydrolase [Siculibacillus lacustris]TBW34989.1 alpha/beta hydrolase [Siculibacillus lacustris]
MDLVDLYPGWEARTVDVGAVKIFARIGGRPEAPPLVCLHGFPQTHVMWHRVAPALAEHFRVILPDLRGYGWSGVAEIDAAHKAMSKRAMAADVVALMDELGHTRFAVVGHDRGARVAHRLALDHPDRPTRLALLDIVPTATMWARMDAALALRVYHWMFLAQPAPMPETLLTASSRAWIDHTLAAWTAAKSLAPFNTKALAHYRAFFAVPERIAATCEDYRAGATIDRADDEADRLAGRRVAVPTRVLWGAAGFPADAAADPLTVWRDFLAPGTPLDGQAIDAGHFLAEEAPAAVAAALLPFLFSGG